MRAAHGTWPWCTLRAVLAALMREQRQNLMTRRRREQSRLMSSQGKADRTIKPASQEGLGLDFGYPPLIRYDRGLVYGLTASPSARLDEICASISLWRALAPPRPWISVLRELHVKVGVCLRNFTPFPSVTNNGFLHLLYHPASSTLRPAQPWPLQRVHLSVAYTLLQRA